MIKHLMVPLDGSGFGEQALPTAVRLAERDQAELELVHVYEAFPPYLTQGAPPIDPALDIGLRKDRAEYLESLAKWLRGETKVRVVATTLEGSVEETLAEHIAQRKPDVVVMATHGRGGLSRLWVGSVAGGVVRRSASPVLLVRPTELGSRGGRAEAFRRVLVPLDGSPFAEEALAHSLAITGDKGAEFTLLHVFVPIIYAGDPGLPPVYIDEATVLRAAERYLEEIADRIRRRGFVASTRVVQDPNIARTILDVLEETKADVVSMETHARKGMSRLLLGSVTDKVVRGASVPVLVHRPHD